MYDRSTKSLWLHVTGRAITGKRKGQKLRFFPASILRWGDWKRRYPATTVLEGRFANGFMGAYDLAKSTEKYGVSIGEGRTVRLYRFADMNKQPLVHDTFGGKPVVVVYSPKDGAARAFLRGDRTFTLKAGVLVDQAGKRWDWFTGWELGADTKALLEPVPATVWRIDRWKGHFPKGEVFKPE
jgi:hypothetical protein